MSEERKVDIVMMDEEECVELERILAEQALEKRKAYEAKLEANRLRREEKKAEKKAEELKRQPELF
jgi:hypothetical protein